MVIFKTALTQDDISYFQSEIEDVIILPKPGANPLGVVTGDGRACMCAPTSSPVPGRAGTPPAPCREGAAPDTNAN